MAALADPILALVRLPRAVLILRADRHHVRADAVEAERQASEAVHIGVADAWPPLHAEALHADGIIQRAVHVHEAAGGQPLMAGALVADHLFGLTILTELAVAARLFRAHAVQADQRRRAKEAIKTLGDRLDGDFGTGPTDARKTNVDCRAPAVHIADAANGDLFGADAVNAGWSQMRTVVVCLAAHRDVWPTFSAETVWCRLGAVFVKPTRWLDRHADAVLALLALVALVSAEGIREV